MSFTFQEIATIKANNESNGFPTVSCYAFLGTHVAVCNPLAPLGATTEQDYNLRFEQCSLS